MSKYSVLISLCFFAAIYCSCKKTHENPRIANCDNLITDTSGTNDTARLFIPIAFTPNSDGLNDISRVFAVGIASLIYTVYDENNNVVFTTTQFNAGGWNPIVSSNTCQKYYYKVQAITNSGYHIGKCGDLHLINCKPPNVNISQLYFEDQLQQNGFTGATTEFISDCP